MISIAAPHSERLATEPTALMHYAALQWLVPEIEPTLFHVARCDDPIFCCKITFGLATVNRDDF